MVTITDQLVTQLNLNLTVRDLISVFIIQFFLGLKHLLAERERGMGHEHSKLSEPKGSRRARFKERLRRHLHRRQSGNGSSANKPLTADSFAGIALLALLSAEMEFKDKWIACVSLGEQTFRTNTSDSTDKPVWNSEKKLLLEQNGAHVARVSVFETNKLSSNTLVGYCEVDLLEFLTKDSDSEAEVFNLLDPSVPGKVVGKISISCSVEDPIETEKGFVKRILSIVDYNEDGMLSLSEFSDLIDAFGNEVANSKKEELFKAADKNGDGVVSMEELASLLTFHQEQEPLLNCCPVCGEVLQISDRLNSMIHLTLCFDEGTGNQVMTGGFLTDKQASYGWFFKLSEWAHFSSYDVGIRSGSSASHILVYDRKSQRLVEEIIDKKIVLSMRAIYQSKIGLGLMDIGVKELLQSISEKQGTRMDSPESSADIPKFIESFKDQINLAEVKYPLEHFKTFNEFFIRELKPDSRPIASAERDDIAVCAADCRLSAFKSVDDSKRFWIKGRKFSVQGLLGKDMCSSAFVDGTVVVFRLAPQDYHRFHFPVSGTVEQFVDIPGCLYTVNPIAVNSKYCNVFTENKRVVSIISTVDFGKVAFVAIGATMVGSITFTKKKGDSVKKGDEFGYFSFGGSTVICVFEKDSIAIDEDLLANSNRALETLVSVGMRLGVSTRKLS
ncbi:phosphatidylserine decarboxylase proenzyme 2-like isoform X1 [Vigna umbellata]|uniref:phosphatidylserine decarboxylase proenzyme 2-like isoform X1 n=3 Tax=Vigna umbellata TaxID=87088 RepID=UPI001F5EA8FA|nr:phosphatidylserine decarboxylase proenzyme 2-like isoform X1 [Vigna umbellata]